jgi:hypothetical protein
MAPSLARVRTLVITALGVLTAIAIVVLVLSLPGATHTTSAAHHSYPVYPPLIQYHGTGAPPVTTTTTPKTTSYIRAEHGWGAVP